MLAKRRKSPHWLKREEHEQRHQANAEKLSNEQSAGPLTLALVRAIRKEAKG